MTLDLMRNGGGHGRLWDQWWPVRPASDEVGTSVRRGWWDAGMAAGWRGSGRSGKGVMVGEAALGSRSAEDAGFVFVGCRPVGHLGG